MSKDIKPAPPAFIPPSDVLNTVDSFAALFTCTTSSYYFGSTVTPDESILRIKKPVMFAKKDGSYQALKEVNHAGYEIENGDGPELKELPAP